MSFNEIIDKFKSKFSTLNFFKKYNYDINKVVGVKDNERYILYADKKLLRIYRGPLKSEALINSYIPIENAIFYDFEIEKSIIEKVDIDKFIETKVYEETGIDETEKYIIKYKIIDSLKDSRKVMVEVVIVSESFILSKFQNILEETGYIDYLSFPAFSYKSLYQEKIISLANDVFVVLLEDKIFMTFYSNGELMKITTLSGGLDKVYEALSKLQIANFDLDVFKKLLLKKGVDDLNYNKREFIVYTALLKAFDKIADIIEEQLKRVMELYNIDHIDRIFITTKYGNVKGLDIYFSKRFNIDTFDFEFYENYNLDRLPIDPLLFLGMLETHYAYKYNDFTYNFSLFLRQPTFFFRPSGQFVLSITAAIVILSSIPLYQYIKGIILENKNKELQIQISKLNREIAVLSVKKNNLEKQKKSISQMIKKLNDKIKKDKLIINKIYEFKYSYLPKSQQLTDITLFLNKNKVYVKDFSYSNKEFLINVFSDKDSNIANLVKDLTNNGYNVYTKGIELKNKKYISQIRIKE